MNEAKAEIYTFELPLQNMLSISTVSQSKSGTSLSANFVFSMLVQTSQILTPTLQLLDSQTLLIQSTFPQNVIEGVVG